jgi:hypothetical protein
MLIDFPQQQYDLLEAQATSAGYSSIPAFIEALVGIPTEDLRGEFTSNELADIIEDSRQGEAELDAGLGIELEEGFQRLAAKHGFRIEI